MLKPIKILVIDDEEDILIETKEILEKKGFCAYTALDSDKALELFQKERPQICLIDIHMPRSRLDGIRVLEELRKLDKTNYCIMVTRVDEQDKIEAAKRFQANRYVLKPFNYHELLELVEEAVKALQR
ncbi:MAG: response regulator [Candidatus Omnitrophica bacterium]|nr:response regulator [Candidatus Omnitrophota bacterium]